ncbi:MAG: SDR family oxidoreductase [Wenzhouxiangella sp.]|nr:SDR family oxidoreductase [Wenzhouxiangella sp.]MCH8477399.1 SDR family oxidoreductase [Wenzhouxiangella sp.]
MSYQSIFKPGLFADQVIVVTGGGSGIGRCTAHELASLGASVVLVGRRAEALEKTADEIVSDGGQASWHVCDIRDVETVANLVGRVLEEHERIDGLFNNAGGQFPAPLEEISPNGFDAVVRTNLTGGFLMMREVYRQSMKGHGGAIVNMLADHWNGMPGMAHSGAARAGMANLTRTAAFEWAQSGVRVNAVAPGWIASSGLDKYEGAARAMIPMLANAVPLKRMGTESEVSAAVVFLLSPGAAFISGELMRIDGAASLGGRLWPLTDHDRSEPYNGFHRAQAPEALKKS